jgi:hypothetical protein
MPKKRNNVVGPRIYRNFEFLRSLCITKSPKRRWAMILNATRDELLSLVEISANIFHKDFQLKSKEFKKLQRYWAHVRRLSQAKNEKKAIDAIQLGEGIQLNHAAPRKRDRVKVIQRGGLLPALVMPVLFEVLTELLLPSDEDSE